MGFSRTLLGALVVLFAVVLAGCGGGKKQDVDEPEGTWKVDVISASFPGKQFLADTTELQITVKNVDTRDVPNLAVTVDGFDRRDENQQFAEPKRPIWVIEDGPENAGTAYTDTWAVGKVPAGQTRTLKWKVTAVRAGTYSVRFRVAAGLNGKAKAELPDGEAPVGEFVTRVSEKPRPVHLD
jgi:hypothetical protein